MKFLDHAVATVLAVAVTVTCVTAPAQTFGGPLVPAVQVPDGAQGPCAVGSVPAVITVNIPPGLPNIANLTVSLGLIHSWYGDLTCTVTGPTSAAVSLLGPFLPCGGYGDSSDLNGLYTVDDGALQSFDTAASFVGATTAIPPASYIGDNPLLATFAGTDPTGVWTFTFTDIALNDLGTVTHVSLTVNCIAESYTVSQPAGPGTPVLFVNQGCFGETFVRIVVVGNAGVPTGWFYGLNIAWPALVAEIGFGYPFSGTLPPASIDVFALPAGILPPTTTIATCGFHFDLSGNPVLIVPAFNFTIL